MFNKDGINNLMKQAQKAQEEIKKAQEEIDKLESTGESGAGLVRVTINGLCYCKNIKISPILLNEDKEMLEDLIIAALNDAVRKINDIKKQKMDFVSNEINFSKNF